MKIVMIAVGGYGSTYVRKLVPMHKSGEHEIVGVVDPFFDKAPLADELRSIGVPVYNDLKTFFQNHTAELATIASPIHLHAPQTIECLENGCHVMCEKPVSSTYEEALEMLRCSEKNNRQVAIGYQWTHAETVHKIKSDILSGKFGKAKLFKGLVLWPRTSKYYGRNNWAGALKDPKGNWVYDSPFNNATSHYINLMYYLLGDEMWSSSRSASIKAELYRANPIENFDTGVMRAKTKNGVDLLYLASHCIEKINGPIFDFEFEKARIVYNTESNGFLAKFNDGSSKLYASTPPENCYKLDLFIDYILRGEKHISGIEAALGQSECIKGVQLSQENIVDFPEELLRKSGPADDELTFVEGLAAQLQTCFEQGKMPSEMGVSWAVVGKEVKF